MGHTVDFILLFEFYQTNLKIQSASYTFIVSSSILLCSGNQQIETKYIPSPKAAVFK